MTQVVVTDTQGVETALDIKPGSSLMQVITDAGVGDLLALCGGSCVRARLAMCTLQMTSWSDYRK